MSTKIAPASVPAIKYADTRPGVDELFRARWSPRSFSSRDVSYEDLLTVLDAARWAASCYNEQPWRFIVATKSDSAAYETLFSLMVPFNQEWAKSAPVLILTVAKRVFSHNSEVNHYGLHDTGAALAQFMLQATALGLHSHAMGGFDRAKARTVLGIPEDYEVGALVVLGYLDSPDKLSNARHREQEVAPRQRKPLSEITFKGRFGEPLT